MTLKNLLHLKDIKRAGWLRVGINEPESVAGHSWGMACLASCLCPPSLDLKRVLLMCIAHDIPEIEVGDITPHDGIDAVEKHHLEATAAERLLSMHHTLYAAYQEYSEALTPESQFVHAIDKLDMALQAKNYDSLGDTTEFIESALPKIPEAWKSLL